MAAPGALGEALAEQITCRRCLRHAPAEALRRAQEAAERIADQQFAAQFPPEAVAELLGGILRHLLAAPAGGRRGVRQRRRGDRRR